VGLLSIKHGATSIWERWNGWTPETGFGDPGMNSFAHYSFGAIGAGDDA
jgi:alpha-L-rhamnosidase